MSDFSIPPVCDTPNPIHPLVATCTSNEIILLSKSALQLEE